MASEYNVLKAATGEDPWTDKPEPFEARQLVVVHETVWRQLEAWAAAKNCRLFRIPGESADGIASYAWSPLDPTIYREGE